MIEEAKTSPLKRFTENELAVLAEIIWFHEPFVAFRNEVLKRIEKGDFQVEKI